MTLAACEVKRLDFQLQRSLEEQVFSTNPLTAHINYSKPKTNGLLRVQEFHLHLNGTKYEFSNSKNKPIGEGSFGIVSVFYSKKHRVAFAIKETQEPEEVDVTKELLKHQCHVLRSRYLGEASLGTNRPTTYVFIMELADGDMTHLLEKRAVMTPQTAVDIVEQLRKQMLCLLDMTPDHRYLYTDMKLENILYKCDHENDFSNIRVFLGDLGSAAPYFIARKRLYSYPSTFPPYAQGITISEREFPTEQAKKYKESVLSWNVGIALLSLTLFFPTQKTGERFGTIIMYLDHYKPDEEIQRRLTIENFRVSNHVIQEFLDEHYKSIIYPVLHRSPGFYLDFRSSVRPNIRYIISTTTNPIITIKLMLDIYDAEDVNELIDRVEGLVQRASVTLESMHNAESLIDINNDMDFISNAFTRYRQLYDALMYLHKKKKVRDAHLLHAATRLTDLGNVLKQARSLQQQFSEYRHIVSNVLFTDKPQAAKVAMNQFMHNRMSTEVVPNFVAAAPVKSIHFTTRVLLDLLKLLVNNESLPHYLKETLAFSECTTPTMPDGKFLMLVSHSTVTALDGVPLVNAMLLTMSWNCYMDNVKLLQLEVIKEQQTVQNIQIVGVNSYLLPLVQDVQNMIDFFGLQIKSDTDKTIQQIPVDHEVTTSNLMLQLLKLKDCYLDLQAFKYICLVLKEVSESLVKVPQHLNTSDKIQTLVQCVKEQLANVSDEDFLRKCYVIDLFLNFYMKCYDNANPLPCDSNLENNLLKKVDSNIILEDYTFLFMRCILRVTKLLDKIESLRNSTETQAKQDASNARQQLIRLCETYNQVPFDGNMYVQYANNILKQM
jgi:hypothetical protein